MKKRLAVLNLLSVILVIAVNYASQALRLNNTTIGEISRAYENLFTPASYAFAIWGLIFLSLFAYAIFQIQRAFFSDKTSEFITQTGYWFVIANILNSLWVIAFVYDYTAVSVLIMLGILVSLIKIILNTNMERGTASLAKKAFVWWPISLYSGWIAVATIANISAYLSKLNWEGSFLTEVQWTITMIVIALLLNVVMLWKRKMSVFAVVGVWSLVAIYSRHKNSEEAIAISALVCAIVLAVMIFVHLLKSMVVHHKKTA
ncbi:hypothetical protein [Cellulophaga sp. Hel_I_12]|uniref:hypothetical protein n=1 Tax=Cellulophaga sp. Hel_I_12 TaxID=1249972 RepID=UPI000646798B|nr:hypothetical protein [Cellulophaga sp. Hel_I_12]